MSSKPPRVFGWMGDYSGCGYYRIVQPFSQLNRDKLARAAWGTRLSREAIRSCPIIVGQRVSNPHASGLWQQLARMGKHMLVFEIDDDLWRIDPSNPAGKAYNNREALDRLTTNVRVADLVTVTTEPLADIVSRLNRNVAVVPNWIDGELLNVPRPVGDPERPVTIGWAGSPTHKADLDHVRDQLVRAVRSLDVKMCFLGTDYSQGISREKVEVWPWEHDLDKYYQRLSGFDMAIAPLRPSVFNRSKSDLRAKELHALGIPAVYTPEPPYGPAVCDGVSGLVARCSGDWRRHLKTLAHDRGLRERLGEGARRMAAGWTIEEHAAERMAIYAAAATGGPI